MRRLGAKLIVMAFLTVGVTVFGQSRQTAVKSGSLTEEEARFPLPAVSSGEETALEQVIDAEEYMVGPGDELSVNIWSGMEQRFALKISPEGVLSVPTVGDLLLAGKNLNEAKELVKREVRRVYSKGEITVHLSKLRKFRIPVSGIVHFPGVYEAAAADRVTHLLEKAGGLILQQPEVLRKDKKGEIIPETLSSQRNILLIHREGDTTRVDFLMFARSMDADYNPFVEEGDAIYVPPLSEEIGTVEVNGAVKMPGIVEYAPGDKLADLIRISGGFRDDAKRDAVIVTRCTGKGAEFRTYYLDMQAGGGAGEFKLESDDRVLAQSEFEYHLRNQVTVTGEVKYPGVYSIVEKQTRLSELISLAGGFTDKANLSGAKIIRTSDEEIADPEFERLKLIPVADMTEMEYEYFKTKSREKVYVVADFEGLFNGGDKAQDVLLRDNDEIEIPVQAKTVRVSGQVLNPGLVKWEEGKNYQYYIEKCGGYSYNARKSKTRIIRASTGTWLKPTNSMEINFGDTIFIPEVPERDYWVIFKDTLLVLSQMVTIIVLVNTLNK